MEFGRNNDSYSRMACRQEEEAKNNLNQVVEVVWEPHPLKIKSAD